MSRRIRYYKNYFCTVVSEDSSQIRQTLVPVYLVCTLITVHFTMLYLVPHGPLVSALFIDIATLLKLEPAFNLAIASFGLLCIYFYRKYYYDWEPATLWCLYRVLILRNNREVYQSPNVSYRSICASICKFAFFYHYTVHLTLRFTLSRFVCVCVCVKNCQTEAKRPK